MPSARALRPAHWHRLRQMWRSAGWPCHDALELDLLGAGLLLRCWDEQGHETLRVTDDGIQALAAARQKRCAALDAHEALVEQVSGEMQRAGRVVWRGLTLRAALPAAVAVGAPVHEGGTRWALAMPDVYSIRHTSSEDCTEPIVHEVKVSRGDLLADLRRPDKGAAYLALSSQCWYVLRSGIATLDDVPAHFGVMVATGQGLEVLRAAPRRPRRVAFPVWMALARHQALPSDDIGDTAGLCAAEAVNADVTSAAVSAGPRTRAGYWTTS